MKIAGWDTQFTRFVLESLDQLPHIDVDLVQAELGLELLRSGKVDVALLPADVALLHAEDLEVLPGAAISTWSNPYAVLELPEGFQSRSIRLESGSDAFLQRFVAAIVVREHYQMRVDGFVGQDEVPGLVSRRFESSEDPAVKPSTLIAQTVEAEGTGTPLELDLGQEWVELTNYPMVWGLFVTRRKEASPEKIRDLIDAIKKIDEERPSLLATEPDGSVEERAYQEYCLNELRMRLDDLAIASLTELSEYLFFYGRADSIPAVILASLPSDSASST